MCRDFALATFNASTSGRECCSHRQKPSLLPPISVCLHDILLWWATGLTRWEKRTTLVSRDWLFFPDFELGHCSDFGRGPRTICTHPWSTGASSILSALELIPTRTKGQSQKGNTQEVGNGCLEQEMAGTQPRQLASCCQPCRTLPGSKSVRFPAASPARWLSLQLVH